MQFKMASMKFLDFRAVCTVVLVLFWSCCHQLDKPAFPGAEASSHGDGHDHGHADAGGLFGDPFEEILTHLNQVASERNITEDETGQLIHTLFDDRMRCKQRFNATYCHECLHADDVFTIVGVQSAHGLDEEQFNRACVVLLYYVAYLGEACGDAALRAMPFSHFEQEIMTRLDTPMALTEDELVYILNSVNSTYAATSAAKCFTHESVFEAAVADHEAGADDHELEAVAAIVVSSLVRGYCIGEATMLDPDAFLDDIFDTYATDGVMSEDTFIKFLGKLSIGSETETGSEDTHDHDHARRRRSPRDFDVTNLAGELQRRNRRNAESEDEHDHEHHHHHHHHHHDHDHHHDDHGSEDTHDNDRRRRSPRDFDAKILAGELQRRNRRNVEDEHDHDHAGEGALDVHSCFNVDDLLEIAGANHSIGLTRDQFKEISPALIQQAISGACVHSENVTEKGRPSAAEVWGYGILAVFIISLCAVAGVAFLPCLDTGVYEKVLQTMMALAVATLVGDAVIHLIPQAVGLHNHDVSASSGHEEHSASSEELAFIWKCLVVVAAVYAFFLFESIMTMCGGGHSHAIEPDDHPTPRKRPHSNLNGSIGKSQSKTKLDLDMNEVEMNDMNGDVEFKKDRAHSHERGTVCCGIGSLPFMILIGDGLHNLGDGLAIGAGFATGIGPGISTSIAVFCHELPHELGDFAVLLNSGLSFPKAILFNVLSALMAFVGLFIGIPLASFQEANQWIFAVAAGMFLYVALVDMLPEMIHHNAANKGTIFILHNLGFLLGSAIILVIALYEDSINVAI